MKRLDKDIYIKMQNLVSEYALDSISEEDKTFFELHIIHFPELNKEVEEVRNVFTHLAKFDLSRIPREHSKNISVKVADRMQKKEKWSYHAIRFALPVCAFIVVVFIMMNNPSPTSKGELARSLALQNPPITQSEAESIVVLAQNTEELSEVTQKIQILPQDYSEISSNNIEINKAVDEFMLSKLLKDRKALLKYLLNNSADPSLLKDLENLDENDFQLIYEAIQNEDFNS